MPPNSNDLQENYSAAYYINTIVPFQEKEKGSWFYSLKRWIYERLKFLMKGKIFIIDN